MFIAGTLVLASCASSQKVSSGKVEGEWNIKQVNGKTIALTSGQVPFLGFNAKEGRVYGFSGCNRVMASFDAKSGKLFFDNMGSTMMACPDMQVETEVLGAITTAKSLRTLANNELALCDESGKQVATLERRSLPMDYAAFDGDWHIVSVNGQPIANNLETVPTLSFDTKEHRLDGTTGCNRIMGNIETGKDGKQDLSFGQVASTRMMCADMELEREILAVLPIVKSFGKLLNGNVALFSDDSMLLMELSKN